MLPSSIRLPETRKQVYVLECRLVYVASRSTNKVSLLLTQRLHVGNTSTNVVWLGIC